MASPAEIQLYQRMARLEEERRRALAVGTPEAPREQKSFLQAGPAPLGQRLLQMTRQWLMHPLIELRNPSSTSL